MYVLYLGHPVVQHFYNTRGASFKLFVCCGHVINEVTFRICFVSGNNSHTAHSVGCNYYKVVV